MSKSRLNLNLNIKLILKIDELINYRKQKYGFNGNYGRSEIVEKILQDFFQKIECVENLNKKFENLKIKLF